jgi:hypothetical protein
MQLYHFVTTGDDEFGYSGSQECANVEQARQILVRHASELVSEHDLARLAQGLEVRLLDESGAAVSSIRITAH